jgi:CPA1 family monovalent cation:H+ antiporter
MVAVTLALTLLALTCASSLVRPLLPLPLPFIQIGLGIAAALLGLRVQFEPHTFLLLFIPPLLFADGWRMPRRELRQLRWPLLGNAVGLVLATVLIGGYGLHWLIPSLPLSVAFAIAAVVSPTDAVAVGAVTEGVTIPPRLLRLLESEALLNDASGLVALRFAVAATLTGRFSLPQAAGQFVVIAAGGLAIGAALTLAYARLIRWLKLPDEQAPLQALLPLLLPFGAYWLADRAGVSGILAAVAAGMAANRTGLMERAHYSARLHSLSLWQLIGFAFNGIIFVLLGTQLPGIVGAEPGGIDLTAAEAPLAVLGQIGALTLLLIAIRLVWAMLSVWLERLGGLRAHTPNWRVVAAAAIAGVRGAVTLAGVLTLPLALPNGASFPGRDLAITLATGVILASLLIASIGLRLLLRALPQDADPLEDELRLARVTAAAAAVDAIEAIPNLPDRRRQAVLAAYKRRLERLRAEQGQDVEETEHAWRDLHVTAANAERAAVQRLRDADKINDEVARRVLQELDLIEAAAMQRPLHVRPVAAAR